jgi:hypothetical protein
MTLNELEKNCVFRYRSMNKNTMREILNTEIWHSTIEGLNDPFEFPITLDWNHLINGSAKDLQEYAMHFGIIPKQEIGYYLAQGKINDLRKIIINNLDKLKKSLPEYYGSLFVSCFSGNMKSPLMWSHYSDGMKGVCIAYNRAYLEKESHFKLCPIMYNKVPMAVNFLHLKMIPVVDEFPYYDFGTGLDSLAKGYLVRLHSYEYLYQKHERWNYEKEFRNIIDPNAIRSNPKKGELIKFSREAISAIIIGSKIKITHKKMIIKYCGANNIQVYVASPKLDDYTVQIQAL